MIIKSPDSIFCWVFCLECYLQEWLLQIQATKHGDFAHWTSGFNLIYPSRRWKSRFTCITPRKTRTLAARNIESFPFSPQWVGWFPMISDDIHWPPGRAGPDALDASSAVADAEFRSLGGGPWGEHLADETCSEVGDWTRGWWWGLLVSLFDWWLMIDDVFRYDMIWYVYFLWYRIIVGIGVDSWVGWMFFWWILHGMYTYIHTVHMQLMM